MGTFNAQMKLTCIHYVSNEIYTCIHTYESKQRTECQIKYQHNRLVCCAVLLSCVVIIASGHKMKRSSSWKNLQRTFSSTPITAGAKRVKINRKNVNSSKICLDKSNDFQIEDSDEENVPCVKERQQRQTSLKTTQKPNRRPKSKPLLINKSHNSSLSLDDSIVCSSEDSVDDEPVLRDVSECLNKSYLRPKARSKSLLFLAKCDQNQLNSIKEQTKLKDPTKTPTKQKPKSNRNKSLLNSSHSNQNETIIESDSLDENDSPKKELSGNKRTEIITRQHSADIVFTQTTNNTTQNSNPPVIESESSQFSLKIGSPNPRMVSTRRTRSKKQVKGGLVERLNKVINNNKSEYSFWINERTTDINEPGENMRIDKIEQSYGRILLHCSSVDNMSIESILCVDPSFKKLAMLKLGKTIEVGLDSNGYDTGNGTHFYPNVTKILI